MPVRNQGASVSRGHSAVFLLKSTPILFQHEVFGGRLWGNCEKWSVWEGGEGEGWRAVVGVGWVGGNVVIGRVGERRFNVDEGSRTINSND